MCVQDHDLSKYGLYKSSIFTKLAFPFELGKTMLDIGCGDGSDAMIFKEHYGLKVSGTDVYKHSDLDKNCEDFKLASIYKLPYPDAYFDYAFIHDVLHHIDEEKQSIEKHLCALKEVARVVKQGGNIIIVEGNRYNPLFYPHMVKMLGHNHFTQSYFKQLVNSVFTNVRFKFFEAHVYPQKLLKPFLIFDRLMDTVVPEKFRAYNVAIIAR